MAPDLRPTSPQGRMISAMSSTGSFAMASGVSALANRAGVTRLTPLVGTLGRQQDGDEQGVGVSVVERDGRLGKELFEPALDISGALAFVHDEPRTFSQVSFRVTVRLKTGHPARESSSTRK